MKKTYVVEMDYNRNPEPHEENGATVCNVEDAFPGITSDDINGILNEVQKRGAALCEETGEGVNTIQVFMDMLDAGEVPGGVLVALAAINVQEKIMEVQQRIGLKKDLINMLLEGLR